MDVASIDALGSFEDVQRLSTDDVREVLRLGTPPQRVWAIWALALRAGPSEAVARLSAEPDPGVRRTLAVILAAHGEYDLLLALSRHDPATPVRASAMLIVARLAAGGVVDPAVVREAAAREPALRLAILGAVDDNSPGFLVQIAEESLGWPDREIQLEAFEALIRVDTPASRAIASHFLLALDEPLLVDDACERWLRLAGLESLAEAIATAPAAVRWAVLRRAHAPAWSSVDVLVGDDDRMLAYVVDRSDVAVPARVLARAIMRGLHRGFVERMAGQLAAASRGRALLAAIRTAVQAPTNPTTIELWSLLDQARRYAAAIEAPDAADVLLELARAHPVEQLLGLENAVARWLVAVDAPPDVVPLLPVLRTYCAAQLQQRWPPAASPNMQLALPERPGSRWNGRHHFEELARAIDQVLTPVSS